MGLDGLSTSLPWPFDVFCGTSAATPHVAGVAALRRRCALVRVHEDHPSESQD